MSLPAPHVPLGPIHRRLHAQLVLAAERETLVADSVAIEMGPHALAAVRAARRSHPLALARRTLEELVGCRDPREVLADLISRFHRREGAVYSALLALGGDDAEVRLRLAAESHGRRSGRAAIERWGRGVGGPPAVFDLLSGHLLEGMPCAAARELVADDPVRVTWTHRACPYELDWKATGTPFLPACNIVSAWVRGFAGGCDAGVEYRRRQSLAADDGRCEHELTIGDLGG